MRSTSSQVGNEAGQGPGELKRVLRLPQLVLFGLVYMVPLTVFTTYGIVTQITGGRLPLAYLITLAAMLFTARSYGLMSRAFPVAGSAYTYTQRTFGAGVGFVSGWALLLDYLFLPMINYLVIGIYLHEAIPGIPATVFVVAAIALVTVLNVIGVVSIARTNIVIIAVQAIFIVVFLALGFSVAFGAGEVDMLAPFAGDGSAPGFAPVMAGAAILCLSFLGFDAISTFAEETRNPRKTLPTAIMITTLLCGALFIVVSFTGHVAMPSNDFGNVDSAAVDVMLHVGGSVLAVFFTAAYVAGATGSALVSQGSVARILYAMGRDGVLPRKFFGKLSARFSTPVPAIMLVSVISLSSALISLEVLAEMVSFGALVAFSMVNLAVIGHYFVGEGQRRGIEFFHHLLVPALGFALTIWLWTSLTGRTLLIGVLWLLIGLVYLAVLTRGFTRPVPKLDLTE
ncbi:Putrescine importer PuuP [Arthrobacter sp. MYb224]|uniref:APC family permease n=1 Tax=Micrococcaceae TaxID=1268 RepID=UPI000CFCEEA9|nr:APC family permease [Arthrobacter sp. MYb224]PRA00284.1 Putrescine importer PuuP [Arthrobacter sp. MYb224]